jgi:excisionase family DNA binding protein
MSHRSVAKVPVNSAISGEPIKLKEAAKITGFSIGYLRAIAQSGRLQAQKVGRQWMTTLSAIEEYKRSRAQIIKKE